MGLLPRQRSKTENQVNLPYSSIHKGKRKKVVPAKPKKRQQHEWIKVHRDGREVLNLDTDRGRQEYDRRVLVMVKRQNYICSLGAHTINDPTFEHEDLRGMGGARRDDRIEKDGKPYNSAACFTCNGEKGSRRDV